MITKKDIGTICAFKDKHWNSWKISVLGNITAGRYSRYCLADYDDRYECCRKATPEEVEIYNFAKSKADIVWVHIGYIGEDND